jgi:hypothetical protein
MKKIIFDRRFLIAASLCLALLLSSVDAFARGDERARDNRGHSKKGRHEVVVVNHDRYYYREGRFFRPSWFGFKIAIGVPPVGIVVSYIPAGHRTIVVGGATYYYYDNVYYRASPGGYVVVPTPVVVSSPPPTLVQSQVANAETVTINVPNANGSFTPVTLIKQGNGYIGPQGEYYAGNPTVEQLRVLYGT